MTGGNRLDGETSMVGIDWLPRFVASTRWVTCPQANPSTSPRCRPTWNRPAGNVMPSPVAPLYLPVTGNRNQRKQKEPGKSEGDKVEWADFIKHVSCSFLPTEA